MSQPVKTLGPNDTLAPADSTMRSERIRHLPVIDDSGRVVGILSQRDSGQVCVSARSAPEDNAN